MYRECSMLRNCSLLYTNYMQFYIQTLSITEKHEIYLLYIYICEEWHQY